MYRHIVYSLAIAAPIVLLCTVCHAGQLQIGQPAPDFKNIEGVDHKEHSLADFKDAKLVVLVFTCNHCPVARAYEDRLVALQKDYMAKGVRVIAISASKMPADRLEPMKKRSEQKHFNFPYLYDATQKTGRDYGATVTPHVFLLGPQRTVVYMGAVDDSKAADNVKVSYLRDAIDAVLVGQKPPKEITQQFGCGIKYE